jgi:type VI secretion system secreted protein Hcp
VAFYLQIPGIKGSATEVKHKDWVKADSIDLGNRRNIHVRPGSSNDREFSAPTISDLILTKELDASSPYLYQKSLTGESLGKVIIQACNLSKNDHVYLEYTIYDVMISHYDISGVSPEDHDDFKETIHLNFTKVQMKYVPQSANGQMGSQIISGYDIGQASKL